jgi:NADPH-dependent curcumin reductase CurA
VTTSHVRIHYTLDPKDNFRIEQVAMPTMPPGGVLLRVLYLPLDPYMRGRMDEACQGRASPR